MVVDSSYGCDGSYGLAAIHDRTIINRPYADVAADLFGVGAVSMRDRSIMNRP
nr:hypothetical protein TnSNPV_1 [Trichoplusia ni single nucleopolyhedrovirus]